MDLSFLHYIKILELINYILFQSLFLWIFRSYLHKLMTDYVIIEKFQSLFLWIFRSYLEPVVAGCNFQGTVSILVLMDLSFLLIQVIEDCSNVLNEFQSLFLWIFRSYDLCERSTIGFNSTVSILVLMDLSFLRSEFY